MSNEQTKGQLTLRVGKNTLSFTLVDTQDTEHPISFEPYVVKSGISMAANLREAFKTAGLLGLGISRARVLVDSPVLMVPVELFEVSKMTEMYEHAFPGRGQDSELYNVLPDLNAVAVFAINRDLKLVIDDHFEEARFVCALSPVWRLLHQRSFTGTYGKLYAYFHEQRVDIFAFQQNRFKFCNQFEARRAHDAIYFLLYVWKQLVMDSEHDEMHLVGELPDREWLTEELKKYLSKVYVINPTAEFNRTPASLIKEMPFDLMTLITKGR